LAKEARFSNEGIPTKFFDEVGDGFAIVGSPDDGIELRGLTVDVDDQTAAPSCFYSFTGGFKELRNMVGGTFYLITG